MTRGTATNGAEAGSFGSYSGVPRRAADDAATREQARRRVAAWELDNVACRTATSTASSSVKVDTAMEKMHMVLCTNTMTKDLAPARINPNDALLMDLNTLLRQSQASSTPKGT